HGVDDPEAVAVVAELTAGWPALVHYCADAISRQGTPAAHLLDRLRPSGSDCAEFVLDQVMPSLSAAALDVVRELAALAELDAPLTPELSEHREADSAFAELSRVGLLVVPRPGRGAADGVLRMVPLIAAVVSDRNRAAGLDLRRAAERLDAAGHHLAAARAWAAAGDHDRANRYAARHGARILARGGARALIRLLDADSEVAAERLVRADALRLCGDPVGAMDVLRTLLPADAVSIPAGLAWRIGMVHFQRGQYADAIAACRRRQRLAARGTIAEVAGAMALACQASALSMLGRLDEGAPIAKQALDVAEGTGDPGAIASAHLAAAGYAPGAREADHLGTALAAAERAADQPLLVRVLVNQVYVLLRGLRFAEAAEVAERAIRLGEGSPPGRLVVALHNLGEARMRLGDYHGADLAFARSLALARRSGLHRTALALVGRAELLRLRGQGQQSRLMFEEAVALSRETGESQILIPALAGLSRLLLEDPGADSDAARDLAEEACLRAPPELAATALSALGWAALMAGDRVAGAADAEAAIAAARAHRTLDLLAEALELRGAAAADPSVARASLMEALDLWSRAGAAPAVDRLRVLLGRLPGSSGVERRLAQESADRLQATGVTLADGSPLLLPVGATAPIEITVLGRFEVAVAGTVVPLPAWKSRQARTLVKILVARHGVPIAREELAGYLWPDDELAKTAHRLSVLLSVVRGVFDPHKSWPIDYTLGADQHGVWLNTGRLRVDVDTMLRDAAEADQLLRNRDETAARRLLHEVDHAYAGDAFADDPYESWSQQARDEARGVWVRSLRRLAELADRAGDVDQAVGAWERLLVADSYDESAHADVVNALVACGRHGEARRAFDRWTLAMLEMQAPPPNPRVLEHPGGSR
ncbi:MAG: BTAD domain-containing putative transcriptional regulator, partial [Nocardioides sp.]